MKTKIFIFIFTLFALVSFNACKLDGEANFTPEILFVKLPITQNGDTLNAFITDEGSYRLDTITVGDTVSFFLYLTAYQNNLENFYIKQSGDSSTRALYSSKNKMDSIFTSSSNYTNGQFYLNPSISSLYFPFRYVARKQSYDASLVLSVVSDAVFENGMASNVSTFVLKTPIRDSIKVSNNEY